MKSGDAGHVREERAHAFAIELCRLLSDDKCSDVILLDLRGRSPVTDFTILASGTSDRQMRSAGDHASDLAKSHDFAPLAARPMGDDPAWILLDFVDVVLHIFEPDRRAYYDLEMLWGDAPRLPWQRPGQAPPPPPPSGPPVGRNYAGLRSDDILPKPR